MSLLEVNAKNEFLGQNMLEIDHSAVIQVQQLSSRFSLLVINWVKVAHNQVTGPGVSPVLQVGLLPLHHSHPPSQVQVALLTLQSIQRGRAQIPEHSSLDLLEAAKLLHNCVKRQ